jgi:hypothetical protein
MAIVPWLGVGAAQASGVSDDSCSTQPSGVSGDATCSLLLGPNGTTVMGESWAVRTSDNHLVVWAFPDKSSAGLALCVRDSGAYPAKHQCNATDSDNAWSGTSTTIDLPLKSAGIAGDSDVFWALSVLEGSTSAVSRGSAGSIPGWSPSPTPSSTPSHTHKPSPTPSPSHTHTPTPTPSPSHTHTPTPTPSPSHTHTTTPTPTPSPSHTHTTTPTPSPSVSATTTTTDGPSVSPSTSTSVLGTKLAHTGAQDVTGALVVSLALLGLGSILVVGAQTVPAQARRRH